MRGTGRLGLTFGVEGYGVVGAGIWGRGEGCGVMGRVGAAMYGNCAMTHH